MFSESDPAMFWLNVTNFALGVLVAVFWVAVLAGVAQEVIRRSRNRSHPPVGPTVTVIDFHRRA